MRSYQLCISLLLFAGAVGCKKEPTPRACGAGLQLATVVQGRNMCEQNSFVLQLDGGATYPPDALPVGFQQVGLRVCLAYTTYEDLGMCPCCGGTRLRILSIQRR